MENTRIVRQLPWENIGSIVENGTNKTVREILEDHGLDWNVTSKKTYFYNSITKKNEAIPNLRVNVRDSDQRILGTVSDKYSILQNREAFDFVNSITKFNMELLKVGELNYGAKVWMVGKFADTSILGDTISPYIVFMNSHDGSESVKACFTPVRVVCSNAMSFAMRSSYRSWSARHIGDLDDKMSAAHDIFDQYTSYIDDLKETAETFSKIKVSEDEFINVLDLLYPSKEGYSDRKIRNQQFSRDQIIRAYNEEDLFNHKGTAWGVLQAVADVATHYQYARDIKNEHEKTFSYIVGGSVMTEKVYDYFSNL